MYYKLYFQNESAIENFQAIFYYLQLNYMFKIKCKHESSIFGFCSLS